METIFRKREKALISLAYYISKLLGKSTIDKKSSGETRGRQGSSSRNYDVLGREIMMPDEVRKMDNKQCLIFVRGFNPVLDQKYIPMKHPMFALTEDGGGAAYEHVISTPQNLIGPPFEFLNAHSLVYYEMLKDKGEPVFIDELSYAEFMMLGHMDMDKRMMEIDEQNTVEAYKEENSMELQMVPDELIEAENVAETQMIHQEMKPTIVDASESQEDDTGDVSTGTSLVRAKEEEKSETEDSISYRMMHMHFSPEQKKEIKRALDLRIPKKYILSYAYPENSVIKMMQYRKEYMKKTEIHL